MDSLHPTADSAVPNGTDRVDAVAAAPLRLLRLTNHDGPFALSATHPAGSAFAVRTQRLETLADVAAEADACDILVVDWKGPLAPVALDAVRTLCNGRPCVVVGDADQAHAEGALLAAGAAEWLARQELTPYWLERTLRRLCAQAEADAEAVSVKPKVADDAARAGQERLQALLNMAPVFLAEICPDLTIAWAAGKLGEVPSGGPAAQTLGELLSGAQCSDVEELVQRATLDDDIAEAEITLPGEGPTLLFTARKVHFAGDPFSGVLLTAWDVDRYKQLERRLRSSDAHFRSVLDRTPMLLARLDTDLRYTWVHSGLTDFPVANLAGKLLAESMPPVAADPLCAWATEVIRTGKGTRTTYKSPVPSGGEAVYDLTLEPTFDARGTVDGVTLASLDVTRTHRLQDALRASERRYRTLVQSTSVGVFRIDGPSGRVLDGAPTWERFSGQKRVDYALGGWVDRVHPDDKETVAACLHEAFGTLTAQRAEVRFLNVASQSFWWCEMRLVPIADDAGTVEEWVCTLRDINDRKVAEQQVARHAEELETLLDILPVAVFFAHDSRAEIITGNRMGSEITRVAPGANISLSAHPDARPAHYHGRVTGRRAETEELPMQYAVLNGVEVNNFELEHVYDDGTVMTLFGNAKPLYDEQGNVRGGIAVFMDITERKRLMENLAASEARFTAFMDNLPAQAYIKDAAGKYIYVNRANIALNNLAPDRWPGLTDAELHPNQDVTAWVANDREVLNTGRPKQFNERFARTDGMHHYLSVKFPMRTPTGEKCVGGVSFDVTVQQRTEAALAISEERLRLAMSGAALGTWDWAGKGEVVVNRRLCNYLKVEAVGEETPVPLPLIQARLHPDDAPVVDQTVSELMARGSGEFRRQVCVQVPDEVTRWLLLVGQLHTIDGNPRMSGVAIDITETKRAEEVIRRAQEELEKRVDLRTRQLAIANQHLRREMDERRTAEAQLEEIRRLLARSRESERMRLAHELHDGPMQELATLGFELTWACKKLGDSPVVSEITSIRDRMRGVNLVLRNFAGDLRPPLLDSFGLVAALDGLIEQLQQRSPELAVTASLPEEEAELDDEVNLAIYRICQQALHNIQRHAEATAVRVALSVTPEAVELTVEDNGHGFETPATWVELAREGHMGIVGMEERARALGGSLSLQSEPGRGTRLSAIAPRNAVTASA